jgi:two-component system cell cycle sensor histidine kinase/response regulator CckA
MYEKLRNTGIDVIGNSPWGTHICQFYQTKEDLIDTLVPYFKAGLEDNEFCMWVTSGPLTVQDAKTSLKMAVRNVDDYIESGQLEILDYSQWYTKSGKFDAREVLRGWVEEESQALKRGFDGLRFTGNTFWLERGDWRDFAEYEKTVDNVISNCRILAICSYSLDKCGALEVLDVMVNHQAALVKREGKWERLASGGCMRAEEELKTTNRFLTDLLDSSSSISIVSTDLEQNILFWNKGAEKIFGYKAEEVVGRQKIDALYPDEKVQGAVNEIRSSIFKNKRRIATELREVTKDGRILWVSLNLTPRFDEKGKVIGILGIGEDITDRKQAEDALRESNQTLLTVFESIDADIYVSAFDSYEVLFMNKHMRDSFGKDVVKKKCYQAFRGERQPCAHCTNSKLVDASGEPTGVLVWEDRNPVTKKWYRNYDKAIKWIDGRLVRLQVATDITDLRQAEEKRKNLEAQFLEAQKMEAMGTLAGGIAHDFNNLLMAIQGNASLMLLEKTPGHPDYERLKNIEQGIKSGAELTRQLLGFARGGKYEVKPTDLNELIRRTSDMFGRTKKEITIHTKYQEALWPVEVDRGQIEQALLNLYVNAWQAMPGGGELSLETQNTTLDETDTKPYQVEAGRYVKISVADTGVGMDKKTQQRIFEPFFTTKQMGRGTGLGLASVYGIITNHDGIVTVAGTKGQGTTFTMYLPASEEEVRGEEELPEELLKGSETILLVDDEEMVVEVAQEMLETLGYTVLVARGGREAIEIVSKAHRAKSTEEEDYAPGAMPLAPDLVILDMIMPEMGGGETYDRLKQINPDIRVLLASGYSIDEQAKRILARGCDGFIQKPFTVKGLSRRVREILEKT